MPPRSELPDRIKQNKFTHVLNSLGFEISKKGGKGSHYKATWPKTQKSITIQKDLRRDVIYYLVGQIEEITNKEITWESIEKNL
ncbi:hypothetical protein ACFLZ9_00755 [Patescibacteria group bacterium]